MFLRLQNKDEFSSVQYVVADMQLLISILSFFKNIHI